MAPPFPGGGQGIDIRVKYLNQGQLCYNNLSYYPTNMVPLFSNADLEHVASQFNQFVMSLWSNCVTTEVEFVDYLLTVRGANNNGRNYTFPVTLTGQVVGDTLPVYNTVSLKKIPQLQDQIPVGSDPIKAGRIAVSGVPEQSNANGQIAGVALPSLYALADAVLNFPITQPIATVMNLRIVADPSGINPRQCPVEEVMVNRLGTQLTRKV